MWEIKAEYEGRTLYVEAKLSRALPFFLRASVREKVIDLVRMMVDFERNSAVIDELDWDEFYEQRGRLGWEGGEGDGASFFRPRRGENVPAVQFHFRILLAEVEGLLCFRVDGGAPAPRVSLPNY